MQLLYYRINLSSFIWRIWKNIIIPICLQGLCCIHIQLTYMYWTRIYTGKNTEITNNHVWMQPAELLHVPKCTTLIWNMDVVCIYIFFFLHYYVLIIFLIFSLYSFLILFLFSFISLLCSFTVLVLLTLLYLVIRTYKQIFGLFIYSALPISRGHFSPNNSWRTPITRSLRWDMDVILEFEVLPKLYTRNWCVGWNIVLYCTAIYREPIVLCS